MAVNKRWYGGVKGGRRRDRCAICATMYTTYGMHYVRLQKGELWYDSRFCGACYSKLKSKTEMKHTYADAASVEIYDELRNEHRIKRAANILKYGDNPDDN